MLNREQAVKKLLMNIADELGQQYDRKFIIEFQDGLNIPDFETHTQLTDWQKHVPDEVKEFWHFLDDVARISMWIIAFRQIKDKKE